MRNDIKHVSAHDKEDNERKILKNTDERRNNYMKWNYIVTIAMMISMLTLEVVADEQ
jgi:hypothetical protein